MANIEKQRNQRATSGDSKGLSLPDGFYEGIASVLEEARSKAYRAVNTAMVHAYWEIGRRIVEEQGSEERAAYGKALIRDLSKRLTADYGQGFTATNLRYMRQFYLAFPIHHALRDELTWTHYRALSRVVDPKARAWLKPPNRVGARVRWNATFPRSITTGCCNHKAPRRKPSRVR